MSQFWWEHRTDPKTILGLQQTPPLGFRPCCWVDDPVTKKPSCNCPTTACEMSWTSESGKEVKEENWKDKDTDVQEH